MKRPLSPSALTAAAEASKGALPAGNASSGTASAAAAPAAASRSPHVSTGASTAMVTTATNENDNLDDPTSTKLHAKLPHRTKSVVAMLLCAVCITVPFIAWNLTIGQGPPPPTFQFHQCNDTVVSNDGNDAVICCNGLSEICHLPVNEVLFATAHNAHSSREYFFLRPNHRYGIDHAMEYGYRAFLLDVCSCPPIGMVFCHGVCAVGTVSTDKVLGSIRRFLLDNPNEVILLEFQMHSADVDWLFALQDIIVEVGLGDMVHVHGGTFFDDWATMRELIETNERLILFQHNGPYCWPPPVCPEMFHTFHWYAVETSYSVKGANTLLNHNQSCEIVAGWNETQKFLLVNHFAGSALGLPKLNNAKRLNQRDVLEERIATCTEYLGMKPNLVAIDFWSIGDLPAVVQEQNRMRALEILSQGNGDDDRYTDGDDASALWG